MRCKDYNLKECHGCAQKMLMIDGSLMSIYPCMIHDYIRHLHGILKFPRDDARKALLHISKLSWSYDHLKVAIDNAYPEYSKFFETVCLLK